MFPRKAPRAISLGDCPFRAKEGATKTRVFCTAKPVNLSAAEGTSVPSSHLHMRIEPMVWRKGCFHVTLRFLAIAVTDTQCCHSSTVLRFRKLAYSAYNTQPQVASFIHRRLLMLLSSPE